jgi:hypothetical protein
MKETAWEMFRRLKKEVLSMMCDNVCGHYYYQYGCSKNLAECLLEKPEKEAIEIMQKIEKELDNG